MAKKALIINKLPYPLATLKRLQKYINKGFSICDGGLLEIAKKINEMDFGDPLQNSFEFYGDGKTKIIKFD